MNLKVTVNAGSTKQDYSVSYADLELFKAKIREVANEEGLAVLVTVMSERRGVLEEYAVIGQETPAAA